MGAYIKEERNNLGAAVGIPKTFAFRATPTFLGGELDCLRNFCSPSRQNFCLPCRTPQNRTKWLKTAPFETITIAFASVFRAESKNGNDGSNNKTCAFRVFFPYFKRLLGWS